MCEAMIPPTGSRYVVALLMLLSLASMMWPHSAQAAYYDKLCSQHGAPPPSFREVRSILQRLHKESEADADYEPAASARMCNLNLSGGDFRKLTFPSHITNVNFSKANLDGATIYPQWIDPPRLNFSGASLRKAVLCGHLRGVNFDRADLSGGQGVGCTWTDMRDASLILTKIEGTEYPVYGVSLDRATFVPVGTPHEASRFWGLASIQYPEMARPQLQAFREYYRRIGFRDTERELTHAIEANTTRFLLHHAAVSSKLEGIFRFVVFDLPTSYGLYPGRALRLILIGWVAFIPIYARAIAQRPINGGASGIYLNLPADRLIKRNGTTKFATSAQTIRLNRKGRSAWRWAAYFSLLSAFNVGFREINVGTWIERIQKRKFQLEAVGTVRRIAGLQSLLSVFLLAMWILTYFGRPFQ